MVVFVQLLRRLVEEKRYDEALVLLSKATKSDPQNPELYCKLSSVLACMGEYAKAEEATNSALRIDNKYPRANYLKAVELAEIGKTYKAIMHYKTAIENYPRYEKGVLKNIHLSEAHNNIGNLFYHLNKVEDARRDWLLAVRYDSTNKEAKNNIRDFKENPGKDGYYEYLNDLGVELSEKGRLKEAIDVLNKAIKLKPEKGLSYYNIGLIYGKINDFDNCVKSLKKFIKLDPNNSEVRKIKMLIKEVESGRFGW